MKKQKQPIAIIMVLIICAVIIILQIISLPSRVSGGKSMVPWVISVSIAGIVGWMMLDKIRDIIKEKAQASRSKSRKEIPKTKKCNDEQLRKVVEMRKSPTPEYVIALKQTAALLSDGNTKVVEMMDSYEKRNWHHYFEDFEEADGVLFYDVFLMSLEKNGFLGSSDWKFGLPDLIYNSRPALAYYGIDIFDHEKEFEENAELRAPEALQKIKGYLPENYGLATMEEESDSIHIVIAPAEKLEQAKRIMSGVGERVTVV